MTTSRRSLTAAALVAPLAAVGHAPPAAAQAAGPEKIFRGGTIRTMRDAQPVVQAVAIGGGRIIAAGTEAEVMALRTPQTEVVDLRGATLMPSFIDGHGHFANAPQIVQWANVSGVPAGPVTKIADVIEVLKAHQARLRPAPGAWIIAYGYDRTNLAEQREMTRDDLDPHFPDNPVMLIHSSNHGAVLNSAGFRAVNVDASTPTPPGGLILRREGSQEPAGLLMETAFLPIFGAMPQPSEAELLDAFDAAQRIYASVGVTTAQEGATHAHDLRLIRKAAEEGRLYIDVVAIPIVMEVPKLVREYFPDFRGGPAQLPDTVSESFGTYRNRLKLGGVKLALDGSPQGKTAFWTQPLLTPGPAGEANWRGAPLFPPEMVNRAVAELYAKGVQVFCHCNGDAAIDMMIDAARAAGVTAAQDRRTVIIHSQFMRPDQLDAYVALGFSPSFFTVHAFFWGDVHVENLGEQRAFFLSPMASAKAKGIRFSNHNDFSVTPMDPMRMVWSAVTRRSRSGKVIGPNERVDVMTALRALTVDAAWQIREEDRKGAIAPGMLADLVILDADPVTVATDAILDIKTVETFKEGRSVYRRAA
ncbi:amidohydrolase [Neoroseomonas oryzicola]|uniref:Amidohydrolase n=1 Tax=Neoroseomonas oryzicola TaxID=535904 RepID=A0A9X9WNY1_9PROT|nr:amidohydrolase [Neoroseomonas oryzicola]MBR0662041.1 amidohydrolase [Neoroseomonas oryzicola]NKE18126.1 amidohydrolase [Neoroseomonas oryzicola]